jgi:uncharacterized protein (UPF0548 family)
VAIRIRRPNAAQLAALLARCRTDELTYAPTGGSLDGVAPVGLTRREWTVALRGASAFDRGCDAIRSWGVHRGAGLDVLADGPPVAGTNVAMIAPLPFGFVEITCRVVVVVDEPNRFGFAYGTLPVHPEVGEESFVITRTDDGGGARFDVQAVSRPVHPVARALSPVAHRLQDAAVRRYLSAMRRAVSSGA